MGEQLVIDPVSEDASNVALNINDGTHYKAMSHSYPTPERAVNWSSSADTEGELAANLRYQNRTITIEVRVYGTSEADALTNIGKLEQKVGKINDGRGGTLKRTTSSGQVIVFDLLAASVDVTQDNDFLANFRSVATITLTAKPFGRGPEEARAIHAANLVPNASFETNTTGWTILGSSWASGPTLTRTVTSFTGSDGVAVGRITATKDATGTNRSGSLEVLTGADTITPGEPYSAALQLRSNDAPAGGWDLRIDWRDGSGTFISSSAVSIYASTVTTPVQMKLENQVAPEGAKRATLIVLFSSSTSGDTVSFDVDAAQLTRGETVPAFAAEPPPVLVFSEPAPVGDVPALARLVVENDSGHDQLTWLWGIQARYYDPAAEAELFFQAEKLTPLGSAEVKEISGATPTGKNAVFYGSLATQNVAFMSTTIAATGHDLSHVGTFRVFGRFLRPATNTGAVTVALEWAQGDLRRKTLNEGKTWNVNELEGEWVTVDLGLIELTPVTAGLQRWEGRIVGSSTASILSGGDDIYCDCLYMFPTDEGYGGLEVVNQPETPSVLTILEQFKHGNTTEVKPLEGFALEVGTGKWEGKGRTGTAGWQTVEDELTSEGKPVKLGVLVRSVGGDTEKYTGGALALAGSESFSGVAIDIGYLGYTNIPTGTTSGEGFCGLVARWASTEKWFMAGLVLSCSGASRFASVVVVKRTPAGGIQGLVSAATPVSGNSCVGDQQLEISEAGAWVFRSTFKGFTYAGQDPDLAVGGTLASGKVGIYDGWTGTVEPPVRSNFFTTFSVSVPANKPDAAVYANEAVQVRWDRVQREDEEGKVWVDRRDYKGAYLRVPAAGMEGRTVRVITKLARGQIGSSADGSIDPLSARLYVQPRYLVVPEP